jgi:hypothetical protein
MEPGLPKCVHTVRALSDTELPDLVASLTHRFQGVRVAELEAEVEELSARLVVAHHSRSSDPVTLAAVTLSHNSMGGNSQGGASSASTMNPMRRLSIGSVDGKSGHQNSSRAMAESAAREQVLLQQVRA